MKKENKYTIKPARNIVDKSLGLSVVFLSVLFLSGISCENEVDLIEMIVLENVMTIDGSNDPSNIFTPIDISIDGNGKIFILDPITMTILKFSSAGVFQNSFGGIGEAPWEFRRTGFNFDIDNTGRVYVIDLPNNIKVFSNDGDFLSNINVDLDQVFDIAVLDSNSIFVSGHPSTVLLSETTDSPAVYHINTYGEVLNEYGSLHSEVEDLGLKNMLFDCAIDIDQDNFLYFTSVGEYKVHKYSSSGDLIWETDGPMEIEPYTISHGEEGSELVPVVMDLDYADNRVFVLWAQGVTDNGYRVDVFDSDDGNLEGYFYTLVPSQARNWSIEVNAHHFFVVDYENAHIHKYDMIL